MKVNEVIFEGLGCQELAKVARELKIKHVVTYPTVTFFCDTLSRARKLIKQLQELAPEDAVTGHFRLLATQPFTSLIPKLPAAEIEAMQAYVDKRVAELNITVYAISKTSCGLAHFASRRIKIPKVKDVDTFCVCLHEIGHIINGYIKPVYVSEYHTEQQALRQAKEYAEAAGISKRPDWLRALKQYEERAKGYVIWHIAKGYKAGLRIKKILPEVRNWLAYDFSSWPGNRVEVEHLQTGYKVTLKQAI